MLLDSIINHVPCPLPTDNESVRSLKQQDQTSLQYSKDPISPDFTFLVSMIEHLPDLGYCVTGKVFTGFAMKDSTVYAIKPEDRVGSFCR